MVSAENAGFGINILLHVCILFSFLTVFFIFYISDLTREHIDSVLSDFIKEDTPKILKTIDKWDKQFSAFTGTKNLSKFADTLSKEEIIKGRNLTSEEMDQLGKKYLLAPGKGNLDWNELGREAKRMVANNQGVDPGVQKHDRKVRWTAIIITIVLFLLLIGVILYFKFYRKYDINLKNILIENVIVFSFVGMIEFFFFTRIAAKYVPVNPGFVGYTVTERLKNNVISSLEKIK